MSNNLEQLRKLLKEAEKRAEEEKRKRLAEKREKSVEKRRRLAEERAREQAEKRAEEAEKRAEEEKRAREEAEKPAKEIEAETKPFRNAIQDGSTIMLRNGPFANLQLLNSEQLTMFKGNAFSALQYCVKNNELETFSKGFRVFFSMPIKCDIIESKQVDKESQNPSQKEVKTIPKGSMSVYTEALFDIEPNFEKILEDELNVWFEDSDAALLAGSKDAIGSRGAKYLLNIWSPYIQSEAPTALHIKCLESLTTSAFFRYILGPIIGIFKASGIDLDPMTSISTSKSTADYAVCPPNEGEKLKVQLSEMFTHGTVPEKLCSFEVLERKAYLVVEMKRMGLSNFVDCDKLLVRSELNSLLKQCFVYMIVYGTDMVLLSDFQTSILLELNFDMDESCVGKPSNERDYEEEMESIKTKKRADSAAGQGENTSWVPMRQEEGKNKVSVPLRYRIMSMYDTEYTQHAIIASAIYSKIKAGDSGKLRASKQLTKLRRLATRTLQEYTDTLNKKKEKKEKKEKKQNEKEQNEKEQNEKEQNEKEKNEKEQNEKDTDSTGFYKLVELNSKGLSVLQEGHDYWSQVYKIEFDAISLSFPWIDTNNCKNHDVVVKIYDISMLPYFGASKSSGFHSIDELTEYVESMATNEAECYKRIKAFNDDAEGDHRIRSPTLYHSGWCVLDKPPINGSRSVTYVGFYLVMSHLKKTKCQMTDTEIEIDGLKQLDLLHSIGIEHGDVKPKNYFITHNGVQFFDFSHSRLYDGAVPDWRAQEECEKFKAIFMERSKSETADVSLVK